MTIAKGLILLLAIPLLALLGLGFFVTHQLDKIESHSQFMNIQVDSLSTLGNILRCFAESRVSIRTYLLAGEKFEQGRAETVFRENQAALNRLLARYAQSLITSDEDRRMCSQFQDLARRWSVEAGDILSRG